jgi:serine protease Do
MEPKAMRGRNSKALRMVPVVAVMVAGLSCLSGVQAAPEHAKGQAGAKAQKGAAGVPKTRDIELARRLGKAFSTVAEHASRSVVSIRVEQRRRRPRMPFPFFRFGPHGRGDQGDRHGIRRGNGSGVIIRSDGYVLTNNHVVEKASHIEVILQDGRRFEGEVVGRDPATDLAVVQIDASGLPRASFADSTDVKSGQWVLAIGSPFGLDYTTTAGVISAVGRAGLGANEIEDYIQTDASINPGNSGGPLVNLSGKVVGINTMIVGRGTGIGFAVPSNLARTVSGQLIDKGKVQRAWIGVTFQELTPRLARRLDVSAEGGAVVSSVVDGGPADEAGVKPGDVIVSVDGEELQESQDLLRKVIAKPVGSKVQLGVIRDGDRVKLEIETGERPDAQQRRGRGQAGPAGFGLQLQELTPRIAQQLGLEGAQGVVVTGVQPGSPAQRAGLKKGDVIVEADKERVREPEQVEQALSDGSALLRVRRGDGAVYVVLEKSGD